MIKLNDFISLSEANIISERFSIDWTETFQGIKIPHRKQNSFDCENGKLCSDCVIKPKTTCFNCQLERACISRLELLSQKKTYSNDFIMLERKPPNE